MNRADMLNHFPAIGNTLNVRGGTGEIQVSRTGNEHVLTFTFNVLRRSVAITYAGSMRSNKVERKLQVEVGRKGRLYDTRQPQESPVPITTHNLSNIIEEAFKALLAG